jgi:very-short-patch-repair endonuclease
MQSLQLRSIAQRMRRREELASHTRRIPWQETQGYRIIRFRNEELMVDLDAVLKRIQLNL